MIFYAFLLVFSGYVMVNISRISLMSRLPASIVKNLGSHGEMIGHNAHDILMKYRTSNVNRVLIGSLNINSLASKIDDLRIIIDKNLDILTIQETKLDSSFPDSQFSINGFKNPPYRLDRNRRGGGVLIYIREDIPSRKLTKHSFNKPNESLFIEINLRTSAIYHFLY